MIVMCRNMLSREKGSSALEGKAKVQGTGCDRSFPACCSRGILPAQPTSPSPYLLRDLVKVDELEIL